MFTLKTLSRFLDSLEEGVLFLDRDRQVMAINDSATELLGRDRDGVLNQLCPSIFAETACARACEARGQCTLSRSGDRERQVQDISLRRPDGLGVHLRMWSILLPPNEADLYCAIILRDRSREVELEGEVRERLRLGGIVGQPGDAGLVREDPAGGGQRCHRAGHGRERHRQGTGSARPAR